MWCYYSFWKDELYKYITGIVQGNEHRLLAINGMPDHVHVFFGTYIQNQEGHHQHRTFLEEYKNFLEEFSVEYDERYIFKELE